MSTRTRLGAMAFAAMMLAGVTARGQGPIATGGTVTNYPVGGRHYRAHLFTESGSANITFSRGGEIEVLLVAGGGGGGHNGGGGGGAGGVLHATGITVTNGQSVTITVGDGGAGSSSGGVRGGDGENTVFGNLIAHGGGGGASRDGGGTAGAGGSGGGGGGGSGRTTPGPIIVEGQGHVGGAGVDAGGNSSGGGGGGAGAPGTAGVSQQGGNGGDGRAFDLAGTTTWYAGGGGGGKTVNGGAGDGGEGGGGDGAYGSRNHGQDNTGGGGGGGSGGTPSGLGGNGGSGIVIVRYVGFGIENLDAADVATDRATLTGWLRSTLGETDVSVHVLWGPENGANGGAWANTNTWDAGHWAEGSFPELEVTGLAADATYYYTFGATSTTASAYADPPTAFITGEVTVEATVDEATPGVPGRFTIRRPEVVTHAAITVYYTMSGDAVSGLDYAILPGSVTIAAGESEATVDVIALIAPRESSRDATLTLLPVNCALGASDTSATVTILPYTGLGYVCVVPTGESTPAVPYDTWATAAQDIQTAVSFAGTNLFGFNEVVISNGAYNISSQIDITNAITVRSFEGGLAGAAKTIIQRSSGTTRIVRLAHPDAIVEGLTLRNGSGQSGAGAHLTGGLLRDCIIRDNAAAGTLGGGIYIGGGGIVSNCVVQSNTTGINGGGGGVYVADGLFFGSTIASNTAFSGANHGGGGVMADSANARVENCMILYNQETRDGNGAGVRLSNGARLRNSLVRGNSIPNTGYTALGGGIYMVGAASMVENCTVVDNMVTVHSGGGIYQAGGNVINSIVYLNSAPTGPNHHGGVNFAYTCTTPIDGLSGPENTALNPLFVSVSGGNFRIESGPARGTGSVLPWMNDAADLDGEARLDTDGKVDMGAYQYHPGALVCSLVAVDPAFGPAPFSASFQAFVDGADMDGIVYRWDFQNNGFFDLEGSGHDAPTHVYDTPGIYSVRLSVTNAAGEVAAYTSAALITVTGTNIYVNMTGSNDPPYLSPATAANSLLDALNIAGADTHIQIGTGTYTVAATMHIDRAVRVSGLSGPSSTIVERTGAGQFRVFHLAHADAVVEGLTIRNGGNVSGSGATVAAGILRDCVLRDNGGTSVLNIMGGTVSNSVIRHNTLSIPVAIVDISSGLLYASSIVSNTVSGGGNSGGGILASGANALVSHCTIAHNAMTRHGHGAGVRLANGALLRNSLIVSNTISSATSGTMQGGGVYIAGATSLIENCTIVGNSVAQHDGGGIYMVDGAVRNSIVINNAAPTVPATDNYRLAGSGITYSLSTPLPAGEGNIDDDPLFVDAPGGDFRLQVKPVLSPAIDAGLDQAWMTTATDLDGNPRLQNKAVDMGAYEMLVRLSGSLFLLR